MSLITLSQFKDLATRAQAYAADVASTTATALESLITRVETLEEVSSEYSTIEESVASAEAAADEAQAAAASAQSYYEATETLSVTLVGDLTLSVNTKLNCLDVTYTEDDE